MKELLRYLKPLKNRIHLKYVISTVLPALALAEVFGTVLVLFSKFVYVYGVFHIVLVAAVLVLSVALVVCEFVRPSDYKIACIADSLGFKERFVTAVEISNRDNISGIEQLVIEDAVSCAKNADFKSLYKILPDRRLIIAPFAAAVLFAAAYFAPIPPSETLTEQEEMHSLIDSSFEEMTDKIDTSNLTNVQKKELKGELNDLKKELSRADDKAEAVNGIMQGQTKLKKIVENSENEQLKAIGGKLSQNEITRNIGELLESGNIQQFTEEVKNLSNSLSSLSDEQIKQLGKAFKAAAESTDIDEETKSLLNELGDIMQSELTEEQLAEAAANLNELSDKISELAKQNSDIRDAVEKLNNELAAVGEKLGGNNKSQGNADNQQGGTNTRRGESKKSGNTPAQGKSGGNGRGKGSIANANVYTAKAQNYGDYDAELGDKNTQGTGKDAKTSVNGEKGQIVPYADVYSEYKNEAMKNIEQEEIPYGVKDIVRDYFSAIE